MSIHKMKLDKGKIYLWRLLFLFYFITFAASPLTYHPNEAQIDESSLAENTEDALNHLNVFLLELFYSNINKKAHQAKNSSSEFFFIKKTRAIIRPNIKLSSTPLTNQPAIEKNLFPTDYPAVSTTIQDNDPKTLNGFLSLYSGLSPPVFNHS